MRYGHPGHTLTEYGIAFGLVTLLAMGGLSLLGGSIFDLLAGLGGGGGGQGGGTHQQMANMSFGAGGASGGAASQMPGAVTGAAGAAGPGSLDSPVPGKVSLDSPVRDFSSMQLQYDTKTGQIVMAPGDSSGMGTNATGSDGDTLHSVAQRTIANSASLTALAELVSETPDISPDALKLINRLAEYGRFFAGAEGDYAEIDLLKKSSVDGSGLNGDYTLANTIMDVHRYRDWSLDVVNTLNTTQADAAWNDQTMQAVNQARDLFMTIWNDSSAFDSKITPYLSDGGKVDTSSLLKDYGASTNYPIEQTYNYFSEDRLAVNVQKVYSSGVANGTIANTAVTGSIQLSK